MPQASNNRLAFREYFVSNLLTAWEASGHTFGTGEQINLRELLQNVPSETPPIVLKTFLAPVFAWNAESQQDFYELFDRVLEQTEVQLEVHRQRVHQVRAESRQTGIRRPIRRTVAFAGRQWRSIPGVLRLTISSALSLVLLLLAGQQIYIHFLAASPPAVSSLDYSEIFIPIRLGEETGTSTIHFQHQGPQWGVPARAKRLSPVPAHVNASSLVLGDNITLSLTGVTKGREVLVYEICFENDQCTQLQLVLRIDDFPRYMPAPRNIRGDFTASIRKSDEPKIRLADQSAEQLTAQNNSAGQQQEMTGKSEQLEEILQHLDASGKVEGVTTSWRFGGGFMDFTPGKGLFLGACMLLVLFLGWWFRHRQQGLTLQHQPAKGPPYAWTIRIPELNDVELGPAFKKTLTAMRRRDQFLSHDIDMDRTINATIRRAGAMLVQYAEQTQPQQYLVLIDISDQHNHQARIMDLFFAQLQANEAPIEKFFFNRDPQICWRENERQTITMSAIQHRYQDYFLVICSQGLAFSGKGTEQDNEYKQLFSNWRRRVLLTPRLSSDWGAQEENLAGTFRLLPATPEGISMLVDILEAVDPKAFQHTENKWEGEGKYRELQIDPKRSATELIRALRAEYVDYHLGVADDTLLKWIAACAIPPVLFWDWTRYVGHWISTPEANYLTVENLLRMVRLPWFKEGEMPDDVRNVLLDWLEGNHPTWLMAMRQQWDHLLRLEENRPPLGSMAWMGHRLEIIVNELLQDPAWRRRRELELELEELIHGRQKRDAMVVRYLAKKSDTLDTVWNRRLRPLVKRKRNITWTWRSWVWQVPVLSLIFLGTLFLNYSLPVTTFQFDDYISELRFSPDGQSILVASGRGNIGICSTDGNWLRGVREERAKIVGLDMSTDGQTILSGTNDQDLAFWDASGVPVYFSEVAAPQLVNDLAFHPLDPYQVLCGNYDKTAELWDLQETRLLKSFRHPDAVQAVAFSPDGEAILTGCRDQKGRIWDQNHPSPILLSGHSAPIQTVAVSPNGQYFLTGSGDKTARLWSRDGRLLRIFEGHTAGILAVAFSPDGRQLLTGGADDRVILWSTADGRILGRFRGHRNYVSAVAFSPDGKKILTGDREGKVKLWQLAAGE